MKGYSTERGFTAFWTDEDWGIFCRQVFSSAPVMNMILAEREEIVHETAILPMLLRNQT